jgi:hypothetical protein
VADSSLRSRQRRAVVLFDDSFDLAPGKEWHSNPFGLTKGDDLSVTATSPQRFYAGFFDKAQYARIRSAGPGAFPFSFGKDEVMHDVTYRIPATTDYIIVFRRGVFSHSAPIQAKVVRTLALGD